ncbi:transglycosylase SLT domain-containing protein [Streptomyces sp. SID10853]|uniref:transglycosylase SLT domain-containing protein n=1 Tax=Streptomyces sp. SID10853 TaxID=2706028 RepID=UPI0013C03F8C|nr:transglycosylase SLT domain-containing protein [Streptomyces sp. SID10853]NDZ78123.1 transglycosylase SLT domain-containing protein [Streptomyces sp. SID10853]
MPRISLPRTTRTHKIAATVLVAVGASTALAATTESSSAQIPAHAAASVKPVSANGLPAKDAPKKDTPKKAAAKPAKKNEKDDKAAKAAKTKAAKAKAAKTKAAAVKKSAAKHKAAAPVHYKNNLDGWIKESLAIMKAKHIPGTYEGLHRNIMRESSGNPNAVNNWDINARNGIPSKGLLQVIQPTFDTYHVSGTAYKLTDPVANLTAAANYAAHRYGSIDNVNSAY